ncbi:MAG: DUF4258 domain-containing protein [Chitinophagaceae bacterium]|nr:DUF4258 domain-containing protein [Chitinophagaceae bacterium]
MNRKLLLYLTIFALGLILFFVKRCQKPDTSKPSSGQGPGSQAGKVDRNRGFDRRVSYLEYTQHARCRMECRKITQEEVKEIMSEGKINYTKSNVNASPCPAYALEGVTDDDQRVRIVFGQCNAKTKVITVIDLNTDWSCDCGGDDDKYKNKN